MKIFVMHDETGRITSGAVVSAELEGEMELLGAQEENVLETSLEELGFEGRLEVDDDGVVSERSMGALREVVGRMRVEVGRRRLVRAE